VLAPFPIGGSAADADPSKRPHIVNNSWGGGGGDLWYQAVVNAWRAADIFPAFSAGNSGPGSETIGSPGDYAESFAVGATDINDDIAYFSSRGPSLVTNETKPDVSAPGDNVRSALPNGSYGNFSGTSMASPHVAGCAALIRSRSASLSITQIEDLLMNTAVDLGASGADFSYGSGRIDCYAAISGDASGVNWLSVDTNSGSVTPSASVTRTLFVDASDLTAGSYSAELLISSNDPDEGQISVPVSLLVGTNGVLSIPSNVEAAVGETVEVPVTLTSNNLDLTAAVFSLDSADTCLLFDPSDNDGDGLPDSVTFFVPSAFSVSASYDALDSDGELDIFIADLNPPFSSLSDGLLATIRYTVATAVECQPSAGSDLILPIRFSLDPVASFGDTSGASIGATTVDGSIRVVSQRRGDCNASGSVTTADVVSAILEIFDGDGNLASDAPGGSFAGDPTGCDANNSGFIEAGDVVTIVSLVAGSSGNSTRGALPTQLSGPQLSVPASVPTLPGSSVAVPISFTSSDDAIGAMDFSLDFDESLLSFDPTDSNGDGIPDAIELDLPTGVNAAVSYNAANTDGELRFIFTPPLAPPPFPTFENGVIVTVTFTASADPTRDTLASVEFAEVSFANTEGGDVAGRSQGGAVLITTNPPSPTPTPTASPTKQGETETPTSETPTSETPTSETPTSETPTSETPTSETPTSETPTSETPTSETPTPGAADQNSIYLPLIRTASD
jgi:hypothetical protein